MHFRFFVSSNESLRLFNSWELLRLWKRVRYIYLEKSFCRNQGLFWPNQETNFIFPLSHFTHRIPFFRFGAFVWFIFLFSKTLTRLNRTHLYRAKPVVRFIWNNRASSKYKIGRCTVEMRLSPPAMRTRLSPFSVKLANFAVLNFLSVLFAVSIGRYSQLIVRYLRPLIAQYFFSLSDFYIFLLMITRRDCNDYKIRSLFAFHSNFICAFVSREISE